jgi:thiamine kinase-like enzyme
MNLVQAYLAQNGGQLGLHRFGRMEHWVTVQMTPRFRTSAHVVFLVIDRETAVPILVLKAARLKANTASLLREAASLRAVQQALSQDFDSVPRVLACTMFNDTPILLETGLAGRPMTEAVVRRDFARCTEAVVSWICELHAATSVVPPDDEPDAFVKYAAGPLEAVERVFAEEYELLAGTRAVLEDLKQRQLPCVFEHGDLSAPNLLLCANGRLQVVDWELAVADGLPAVDLFFALNYLASSLQRARTEAARLAAFRQAFFGPAAWTIPSIQRYCGELQLDADVISPLFVLCWVRYTARLAQRLCLEQRGAHATEARDWLRQNRYFQLWRESVRNYDLLREGAAALGQEAQ